jgi:hypothetical protein
MQQQLRQWLNEKMAIKIIMRVNTGGKTGVLQLF